MYGNREKKIALLLIILMMNLSSIEVSQNTIVDPTTKINDEQDIEVQSPNEILTIDDQIPDNIKIKEEVIFSGLNLTEGLPFDQFNLNINHSEFTIQPIDVIELDMNTYFVLDDKGNSKIAPLKQIYRINAYLIIEGHGNTTIDFITNIDSIWLSFEFKNYFYEISPIRDYKTDNELYQIHNLDITLRDYEKDSSASTCKSDRPESQKERISLDTVHYPDLVLAGSVSFYNAYGSNWAAEMENIFDSSGDEDLYSMFYWNDIEWNLRRKFVFTSGGPSSNYVNGFLTEYTNFVKGLDENDPIFPFHSSVILSGHEFIDGLGYAWVDEFYEISHPQDLNSYKPFAMIQAHPNSDIRLKKFLLVHEVSHIAGGIHSEYVSSVSSCFVFGWFWWEVRYVTVYSLMDSIYHGRYICNDGSKATEFFWSTVNENVILSTVRNNS